MPISPRLAPACQRPLSTDSLPPEPNSHEHRSYLCLATIALAAVALLCLAGCQTPNAASTVAPPATGMIGQPAQYGSWATPPQGAAYPPTASAPPLPGPAPAAGATPMPGPATQWQSAAPATQPPNTWSWAQPAATPPATANQYTQNLQNQAQQTANQLQAQPQQMMNQAQQAVAGQQQQWNQQLQNTANQYNQQFNGQMQQGMQSAQQQVTAQMPQYPPQTAPNTSWNPFSTSASSLPPARATPSTTVPRY